ncbi:DUF2948 domain-containing protein [Methylobacterium terrae]|uniref:DUF2948 domain-containing protein n=2 Tax=Methylobacterium terrae TaxID=2202827 RepID=A0A2U8WTB2_9HYPH|nr:DUF2948 domain-containing protein [Methylobacterium terrae]
MKDAEMELLKLAALDADDLAVISTHLQDAVLRTGDLAYLPRERRFALVARRFDWECPDGAPPRRRLTGLHFERVLAVRCRNVSREEPDAPLELLAITFEPGEAPSGIATLVFAGGAAIRLELECIEAAMKDLGPVWQAESKPLHTSLDMPLDAA